MAPSVKPANSTASSQQNGKKVAKGNNKMAFRGNQNRNRNFGGNNYGGGPMGGGNRMGGMNMSPWEGQNPGFGNNMRQGGGPAVNAQALNLANNLLTNLLRNQNPPSLLDLPRGGGGGGIGGGMGQRNQRGGPMVNRGGVGNRLNNRRGPGGFQNRGAPGQKAPQKQGGIRKQNAFDRAKKLLAKNANQKKKENNATSSDEKKTESGKDTVRESPYDSVPNDMFYCHLCKKHMWDATSFENHIKGRTHLMMREGIEESYRLKANMIRQEAKIAEQLKSIEFDRLKRMGKSKQRQLDYCTMCDLNFHGHISTHRKSDGHLQLKKFLHPKCIECNNEFATRIDYDTHLLSADHLKKAAEKNVKVGEHKHQTLPICTEEDETRDLRPPQKRRKKPAKKEAAAAGDAADDIKKEAAEGDADAAAADEAKEGDEAAAADEAKEGEELNETQEGEEEEEVALPVDPEDVILDFDENDEIPVEIDARLPKYNWTRPVGVGLINKLECFECYICGKFFDTETTVEIHSRTATHHRNFLKFINEKSSDTKIAQKRAAAALEASERKKIKLEESTENAAETKDELYDPSEATGDDEDAEMAENGEGEEEAADENGDAAEQEEMQEDEEVEQEAVEEPEPEAEPVKVETPKPEPVKTPAKAAPAAAAPAATPSPSPAVEPSPAKKAATTPAAAAGRNTPRATPARNRGRGRYNRY